MPIREKQTVRSIVISVFPVQRLACFSTKIGLHEKSCISACFLPSKKTKSAFRVFFAKTQTTKRPPSRNESLVGRETQVEDQLRVKAIVESRIGGLQTGCYN